MDSGWCALAVLHIQDHNYQNHGCQQVIIHRCAHGSCYVAWAGWGVGWLGGCGIGQGAESRDTRARGIRNRSVPTKVSNSRDIVFPFFPGDLSQAG